MSISHDLISVLIISLKRLDEHLKVYREQYGAVLAFRPTGGFFSFALQFLIKPLVTKSEVWFSGWTYSEKVGEHLDMIRPTSRGKVTIYGEFHCCNAHSLWAASIMSDSLYLFYLCRGSI